MTQRSLVRLLTVVGCLACVAIVIMQIGAPGTPRRAPAARRSAMPIHPGRPPAPAEVPKAPAGDTHARIEPSPRAAPSPSPLQNSHSLLEATVSGAGGSGRSVAAAAIVPPDTSESESRLTIVVTCDLEEGVFGVADDLQDCIDRAPASAGVEIPRGAYVLHRQIVITKPVTIRTAGSADASVTCTTAPDRCARLVAGPELFDDYGVLLIHSTMDVTLEHVVLDGNRSARLSSPAERACRAGHNVSGFNAAVIGCIRCALRDVVSRHALCGTGMFWSGGHAIIERSDFRANGEAGTRMWADGLTAAYVPDSLIRENRFIDNSDVGLILGYAVRSRIEHNEVIQREQEVFAGLMLDNFNSDDLGRQGDFRGAIVADNLIDCRPQLCLFGIQIGPRPWYPSVNIIGGQISGNRVHGAKVGINVDGAGVARDPVAIFSNRVTDVPEGWFSNCATPVSTDWMNIAPTSVVYRGDELTRTGTHLTEGCQFGSAIRPVIE